MSNDLEIYEFNTHVFVVKIWLEEDSTSSGKSKWRGHITYVPTGQRRYIEDFFDIICFIIPYLEKMSAHVGWLWRSIITLKLGKRRNINNKSEFKNEPED